MGHARCGPEDLRLSHQRRVRVERDVPPDNVGRVRPGNSAVLVWSSPFRSRVLSRPPTRRAEFDTNGPSLYFNVFDDEAEVAAVTPKH